MIKNNLEVDVTVKCLEEGVTQAQLAQMVGTSAPYVSRPINKIESVINKVFVDMLDKLGYALPMRRRKGLLKNEQRKTHCIYGCDIGDHHDNIGAGT